MIKDLILVIGVGTSAKGKCSVVYDYTTENTEVIYQALDFGHYEKSGESYTKIEDIDSWVSDKGVRDSYDYEAHRSFF